MRRTLAVTLTIALVLFAAAGLAACTAESVDEPATTTPSTGEATPGTGESTSGDDAEADAPPAADETDPNVALIENKCSLCHTTERVWSSDYDKATWAATIDRMKSNGLVISDEDYATIVEYLSAQ